MKTTLITTAILFLGISLMAQPRIKQRDIIGLSDSLVNKYTKGQVNAILYQKADKTDARFTDSRPASDVYPWAKTPQKPVYTPMEIGAATTSHNHAQSQVTGLAEALNSKLSKAQADVLYQPFGVDSTGSGIMDSISVYNLINQKVDTTDYRLTNDRPASDVYPWAKLPVKPAYVYSEVGAAPLVHTQGQSTITGLVDSLLVRYTKAQVNTRLLGKANLTDPRFTDARIASDVYEWAKAAVKPSYTYTEVGAAATAHAHTQSHVTGLSDSLVNKYTRGQVNTLLSQKADATDPRLTNSRPASDVYEWAKAPQKPNYSYAEVGAAPTIHSQGQSTITALSDSLTGKYTRGQSDRRYWQKVEAEDASQYFYTKAQVTAMLDSVRQLCFDYVNANPAPPQTSVVQGLISVWEFNEASGTTAADSVGGYNATLMGGTLVNQTGKIGSCLVFDGVDDYARVTSHVAAFDTLVTDFSISVWMKPLSKPDVPNHGLVFKGISDDPWTNAQWGLAVDPSSSVEGVSARLVAWELTPNYLYHTNEVRLMLGDWHHLVVTYSKSESTMQFYLDGQLSQTATGVTGDITPRMTTYLTFGSSGGMNHFNCAMDQTAIWSRPVNAAEVQSIYNSGNGKKHQLW